MLLVTDASIGRLPLTFLIHIKDAGQSQYSEEPFCSTWGKLPQLKNSPISVLPHGIRSRSDIPLMVHMFHNVKENIKNYSSSYLMLVCIGDHILPTFWIKRKGWICIVKELGIIVENLRNIHHVEYRTCGNTTQCMRTQRKPGHWASLASI